MSDPVTNVAIEDVLSSIRRLVSEDARVRPLAARTDPAQATDMTTDTSTAVHEGGETPGKLVLTPALRVSETEPPTEADMPSDPLAEDVADEAAEAPQDAAVEPAGGPDDDGGAWVLHDEAADTAGDTLHDEAALDDKALEDLAEALAWEDHHEEEVAATVVRSAAVHRPDVRAPVGADAEGAPDDAVDDHGIDEQGNDFIFSSTRYGMAEAVRDEDESEVKRDDNAPDADSLFGDDETVLDEDTLRELVTEIVRQELQGALGERITRNVRKLVRREIHRALTSHELE